MERKEELLEARKDMLLTGPVSHPWEELRERKRQGKKDQTGCGQQAEAFSWIVPSRQAQETEASLRMDRLGQHPCHSENETPFPTVLCPVKHTV